MRPVQADGMDSMTPTQRFFVVSLVTVCLGAGIVRAEERSGTNMATFQVSSDLQQHLILEFADTKHCLGVMDGAFEDLSIEFTSPRVDRVNTEAFHVVVGTFVEPGGVGAVHLRPTITLAYINQPGVSWNVWKHEVVHYLLWVNELPDEGHTHWGFQRCVDKAFWTDDDLGLYD